jgi:hypothetical protein
MVRCQGPGEARRTGSVYTRGTAREQDAKRKERNRSRFVDGKARIQICREMEKEKEKSRKVQSRKAQDQPDGQEREGGRGKSE